MASLKNKQSEHSELDDFMRPRDFFSKRAVLNMDVAGIQRRNSAVSDFESDPLVRICLVSRSTLVSTIKPKLQLHLVYLKLRTRMRVSSEKPSGMAAS